ncbi:MAG TPA: tRNA lysidine(34) synthetase TilS [Peptococcaceae bacterium]|nr:tRNA lysidine(34) synthetase TilS [Peptococcaceae bacterium]
MYADLKAEVLPEMIPSGSTILIAVSGGPDSVALAHILYRYTQDSPEQNLALYISHVNHQVRKEAAAEAELVRNLAEDWGVPFILHEFKAKEYAASCQKSFQEAAREWRYARFKEDMVKYGCNLLATAHHLGDQAETVLYRLLRGSGTAGLAGIYPAKEGIIRPLLGIRKEDLIAYCHENGLPYALDKSNYEPFYARNRIRLELIPELENKYNKKIQEALGRTAELLRWDEDYISSQVSQAWVKYGKQKGHGSYLLAAEAWELPPAILSRLLRLSAALLSGEPRGIEYKFIKLLMKEGRKTGWKQNLPGLKVEACREGLLFSLPEKVARESSDQNQFAWDWEVSLTLNEWHLLPGLGLKAGIFTELKRDEGILWWTELSQKQVLELKKPLICRLRRPGDRMYFANLGHKTIKKVFQDKQIPEEKRGRIPFLVLDGLVVWIPGVSRSDVLLPENESALKLYGIIAKV